jgi:hypothetical protein
VLEASTANLSRGMHWLEASYVMWFNRKYQRVGYLFQGRFKSALVESDSYLRELIRYVVLNPVRAGMVDHPSKHRWSSYSALAGLEPTPAWLDDRWLWRLEPDPALRAEKYREFIEEKIGCRERLWNRFVGQIYFGSRAWIETMQTLVDLNPPSDEHTYLQINAGKPEMAQVIEAVAGAAETTASSIRHGHGGAPRMLSAWLGCYEGMRTLRQIAAALRLRSTGYISDLIRRCDRELGRDPVLQGIADGALRVLRPPPLRTAF